MSNEQRIGKYIVEAQLGEGSFAWVYKGYDEELDRHVAIKVLKPMWLSDPQAVNRFKQEARTMAKLHHPNIAVVYEVGEDQGQVYLAQFLVNGDTLSAKLEKEGPMSWPEMMEMLKPVASALDFAHEHNIVHRDIKPANVLVDDKNRAYLGDFGLVRAAEGSASISASTGGMVGTPAYMAPEQWEGHEVSPATDVYALSCVVVEMLTGKMLFDGATPATVMKQHLMEGPKFPAKWPDTVPANVAEVLKRGLTEDSTERIQSAGELVAELEKVEADRETQALMLPWLVDVEGTRYKLKPGENTVGRATGSDVQVDTRMISRLHATLVFDGETVTVNDEGSANGTFVNDTPVGADGAILNPGDTLRVGDVAFALNTPEVSVTPAPTSAEPVEESPVVEEAAVVAAAAVAAGEIAEAAEEVVDTPAPEPEPEPAPPVPEVKPKPEPAPAIESELAPATPPTSQPVAAVAAPPEKKSGGKGMMIVGIVVVLLIVVGACGFFLMSGGDSTPPPAATEAASSSGSGSASVGADVEDTPTPKPEESKPKLKGATVQDVDALMQSGHEFADNGNFDQAIEVFTAVIESEPTLPFAYESRAWAYLPNGEYDNAIADFEKAIELDPEAVYPYLGRAAAYDEKGDINNALGYYEEAITKFEAAGQGEDAEYFAARVAEIKEELGGAEPVDVNALVEGGIEFYYSGDYDQAIEILTAAIEADPNIPEAYFFRGAAYESKTEPDNAITDYIQAIELAPDYLDPYNGLGNVALSTGDYEMAIVWYEEYVAKIKAAGLGDDWKEEIEAIENLIAELKAELGK